MSDLNSTVKIRLTKGYITTIDRADADLCQHKWCITNEEWTYARRLSKGSMILLHHVILERVLGRALVEGEYADHVDGDTLNNRRSNLRVANIFENAQNRRVYKNSTSQIKGVYPCKGKWRAAIQAFGKRKHLGYFENPELAKAAYDKAAQELFGEFRRVQT